MKKLALMSIVALFVFASITISVAQSSEKKSGGKAESSELNWHKFDVALSLA